MKAITVVIPLFNKARHIERCLDSVLDQSCPPAEIVVIDDGSTDRGADIVREKYPSVRLLRQANAGVSSARNRGIAAAGSEYVAFLDADDFWKPEYLETIQQLMSDYPNADVFCTHYAFLEAPRVTAPARLRGVPKHKGVVPDYFASCCNADLPITASSVCISRSLLLKVGGFPVGMAMGEDQVVWAQVACRSPIAYCGRTCVFYDRSIADSACKTNAVYEPAPHVAVFQKMLDDKFVPNHLESSLKYLIHLSIVSCIKNNLVAGRRRSAARLLFCHKGLVWDRWRMAAVVALLLPQRIISWSSEVIHRFR